jgi:hypothetical protein
MNTPEQKPPVISLCRLLKAASATCTVLSVGGLAGSVVLKLTSVPRLPHYLGLVLLATAPVYLARLMVQGIGGYYKRTSDPGERRLARLYLASIALLLVWLAAGILFWLWGSAFWEVFMTTGLWALVTWNACAIVDALPQTSCDRGTEIFRSFSWVIAARNLMHRSGLLRDQEERLARVTPETDTSSFLNRLSLVLVIVALACVPFATVEAAETLKRWDRSQQRTTTTSTQAIAPKRGESRGAQKGRTSTHSTNPPPPPPTPEREPTYDEQCPGGRTRLGVTPDEVGRSLLALWKQEGATAAGCPGRARRVSNYPSVWFAVGSCGATIRSLGVYVPGQGSTMQFQEAATYGLSLAERGELENASSRASVGGGDFVLFETPSGTVAMSRSHSATGSVRPTKMLLWCERYSSTNVPYLKTPPPVTDIWHAVVESVGWSWPTSTPSKNGEASYAFYGLGGEQDLLATALCSTPSQCEAWNKLGKEVSARRSERVTLDEMLEFAP